MIAELGMKFWTPVDVNVIRVRPCAREVAGHQTKVSSNSNSTTKPERDVGVYKTSPGGATALYAVLGGPSVQALGYGYVFSPVLLDFSVLLAVAVLFNYPLMWRRYPQVWFEHGGRISRTAEEKMIPHSNLVYALSQIDTFVDVSEDDLQKDLCVGRERTAFGPS